MLTEYLTKKLTEARYKLFKDGSYFGEIPGLQGVWANARNLEACRKELQEVLEDWLCPRKSFCHSRESGNPVPKRMLDSRSSRE